jgi:hypothetical protein
MQNAEDPQPQLIAVDSFECGVDARQSRREAARKCVDDVEIPRDARAPTPKVAFSQGGARFLEPPSRQYSY